MGRILIALLIVLNPWVIHAADDFATKLKELTRKAREVEGSYLSEEKKLRFIDDKMSKIQSKIPKVQEGIQKKQEQVKAYDKQMSDYEAELERQKEKIRQEWVVIYKSASLDMVTVYYGHEKYAGYLNAVFRHHARSLQEYQLLKQKLAATRTKADVVADLLQKDLTELQGSAKDLQNERSKKIVLVSSLKGKSLQYQDQIEDLLKEIQKREKERKEREKRERAKREKERKEREKREKRKIPAEQEPVIAGGEFNANKGKMPWPAKGKVVRGFGPFSLQGVLQKSQGIDIEVQEGAPVKSIFPGRVVYANWMDKFGTTLILDHGDGFYSIYGHLQEAVKAAGQNVGAQEIIARAGQSGSVLKPTLHFEIRYHQKAIDPSTWLMRE